MEVFGFHDFVFRFADPELLKIRNQEMVDLEERSVFVPELGAEVTKLGIYELLVKSSETSLRLSFVLMNLLF